MQHSQLAKLVFVAASAVASVAEIRSAAAQVPAAGGPQSVLPGVLSTSAGGTIDSRIDYIRVEDGVTASLFALDLHGQYVAPSGAGGYLAVPLALGVGDEDSELAIGNLELGGLYVSRRGNLDLYARGGAALDTADEDGVIAVPILHSLPRPADAHVTGLDTTWLRGGGGLRLESEGLVFGAAAGVDLPLDLGGVDGVFTITAAVGTEQPAYGLAAGLTVDLLLGEVSGDSSYVNFQAVADVALTARSRLYFALGMDLEHASEAQSIGVGLRAGM